MLTARFIKNAIQLFYRDKSLPLNLALLYLLTGNVLYLTITHQNEVICIARVILKNINASYILGLDLVQLFKELSMANEEAELPLERFLLKYDSPGTNYYAELPSDVSKKVKSIWI
jgi:hypothetical protein